MELTIKVLQGNECVVSVVPESTVLELKQQIEQKLSIPIEYQKIIYLGRSLADENTIASYSKIRNGTKLTLIVKKPDSLNSVIFRCFRKFYNEEQSMKLSEQFMIDFEKKIKQFSLDDLERIATNLLTQQGND